MKIDIKELEDVIVELTEVDAFIKERYQEIDETIFIGTDEDEEVIVKVSGTFEVLSIDYTKNQEINSQKVIDAINNAINKIKNIRNNVVKEVILENTREN